MVLKNRWIQLAIAFALGVTVLLLPRPEGTQFKVRGDIDRTLYKSVSQSFKIIAEDVRDTYTVEAVLPGSEEATFQFLQETAERLRLKEVRVSYVNGLSAQAKRFLAILAVLIFLFIVEPIPLEITAICIGVFLVVMGISDPKTAWAPYMHPVVIFIMCCLIFAISLDKAGLTKRLGYFIIRKAGNSITRFTFILAIGLGLASSFLHDAAACAIGIVTMLPLMRAVGIEPHTNTARFMMLSLPFACSCGGMGTLVGGGRNMVAAAFLKEFTGIEITFFDWIKYCMPAAFLTVPIAVFIVYLIFRPDPKFKLPDFDDELGSWTFTEVKTLMIIGASFLLWLTKGIHGIDYSITGMLGVAALVVSGVLKWEDINNNLEWGTALFIFGGAF